ncbi:MAG: secreted protein containing PKD [Bacteroidetes bacterium]|nr:MAG: secreted protein containing PKD [Bacteroidota bacterium]
MKIKKQIIICFITSLFLYNNSYTQNKANTWYFGYMNGMNFNTGYPVYLSDCPNWVFYTTSISDTNGNLLFFTDGQTVWNKDREIMLNGTDLDGDWFNRQPAVICTDPGNSERYYIFTVGSLNIHKGLEYNIVDMALDNGRGTIVNKNIVVPEGEFARHKITAVRQANNLDWWIITRFQEPDTPNVWACFSLTSSGVNPAPVISPAHHLNSMQSGPIKVSHDRKKLISVQTSTYSNTHGGFDVCDFDVKTGIVTHKYYIKEYNGCDACFGIYGMEMSPDSKLLYISFDEYSIDPENSFSYIYQYDLREIDSLAFLNSRLVVNTNSNARDLQLAPDGKIYASTSGFDPQNNKYLGVINNVWERGFFCNFQKDVFDLGSQTTYTTLPSFPSELLYRFVWNGGPCAKTPFTFRHRFIPEPASIEWNFGDGTTSTDFNPTHIFQSGGNYEVHAHVVYPDGRIEETSREVEVLAAPEPQLPDTLMLCTGETSQLDAGSGFVQYNWNGQFTPGTQYFQVSEPGTYTVRVRNDLNCYAFDTTKVSIYPPPLLEQSGLVIQPTTCGNATGSISGLVVEAGTTVSWKDNDGQEISNALDISNLGVGNYQMWLTGENGCTVLMGIFSINNLDSDLIIEDARPTPALCGQEDGQIIVTVQQGLGSMLYSITNGPPYFDNGGVFANIAPGNYNVRVIDALGCDAVYSGNPVEVSNLGGPLVTGIFPNPATGSGSDGSIIITATGDSVYYSLDGETGQLSGEFLNLGSGDYLILVTDKYGCDTTFSVYVGQLTGYALSAIAGTYRVCLRQQATSALKVTNLNGVKEFRVGVLFDNTRLSLQGYDQKFIPELTATDFGDKVILEWQGEQSLTLSDTVKLINLIFETIQPGTADVNWDTSAASWFKDENGNDIPVDPIEGYIKITSPPVMITGGDQRKCEDDFTIVSANVLSGGVEPFIWEWTKPDGSIESESSLWLFGLTQAESGIYSVKLTDAYHCVVEDTVKLSVIPPPTADFPTSNDTIFYEKEYQLQATSGYASYQWNTGDTTYYITVTEQGAYSLLMETTEGCLKLENIMMIDTFMPVLVPNAFTPNNDGLNDTFRPVVDYERVRMFSMVIYNRWGQLIFETTNPAEGWDGKDAPAGVYSWVISYSDMVGKVVKMRGGVTVVR